MKRSVINRLQREALALFAEYRFSLPLFARWSEAEWRAHPAATAYCRAHQMGWDLTDFGSGRFEERGLTIFCVRNGLQGLAEEKPYAARTPRSAARHLFIRRSARVRTPIRFWILDLRF